MDESVRLARMEAKLDAFLEAIKKAEEIQKEHNDIFYKTRDKVNAMEAKAVGAWFAAGIFGAIGAWIVSLFNNK